MDDAGTLRRMGFHLLKLFRGEASGLAQDLIIDRDLPKVVHRRGFDQVPAEIPVQFTGPVPVHFVDQDLDALAGAPDMPAGGVVPAFNHGGHTEDQLVVHFHDVRGLFLNQGIQIGDLIPVRRIIGNNQFIALPAPAAVEPVDRDLVGSLPGFIEMPVV